MSENPDKQSHEEIARAHARIDHDFAGSIDTDKFSLEQKAATLNRYPWLDPNHDVPPDLLQNAVQFFDVNKYRFPNQDFITIVDFKPRSDHYRLFVVHMQDGSVEKYHTTHGLGSDPQKTGTAIQFGNVINSGMSSLGYARMSEAYSGTYGESVRLDGLSTTNSNMRDRAVVFHGWVGVEEANVIEGWSQGCVTLDYKVKDGVLAEVRDGSLMYLGVSSGP
jgi:hypothetical protein